MNSLSCFLLATKVIFTTANPSIPRLFPLGSAVANLSHENKKMTVFEALEVLEALKYKYSFVAGESVSIANVTIFLPKNDGIDTDEDDGNDVNCIPDNLCGRQLPLDAEQDLQGTGGTKLITDESQALASGQVKFCIFSCF